MAGQPATAGQTNGDTTRSNTQTAAFSRRALLTTTATATGAVIVAGSLADSTTAQPAATPGTTTLGGTPAAGRVTIPDTASGRQLAWLLGQLERAADGEALDRDEVASHFDPLVRSQLDPDAVIKSLGTVAGMLERPMAPTAYWGTPGEHIIHPLLPVAGGGSLLQVIEVSPVEPNLLLQANAAPYASEAKPVATWQEVDDALAKLGEQASFTVAEVKDGKVVPIHAFGNAEPLAIGSAFKLYVLATLNQRIHNGEASWDNSVTLTPDHMSLPSGVLQLLPAGTTLPVRTLAEHMIAISDNTAADNLILFNGRKEIEDNLPALGQADPNGNIPFLTTREAFTLKLSSDQTRTEAYIHGDVGERRGILEAIAGEPLPSIQTITSQKQPIAIDSLEWFATSAELAEVMTLLASDRPEWSSQIVRDTLSINPGVPFNLDRFRWIGFKGGSEVGVFSTTWLTERADGRSFVVSLIVTNPDGVIDENAAAVLGQRLLATIGADALPSPATPAAGTPAATPAAG